MIKNCEIADARLTEWGNAQKDDMNLGYPTCSPEQKTPGSGKSLDCRDDDVDEIELLMLELKRECRIDWVVSVRQYYQYRCSMRECAKRMSVSVATFRVTLGAALGWFEGRLR